MRAPPTGLAGLAMKLMFSKWGMWIDHFTRNTVSLLIALLIGIHKRSTTIQNGCFFSSLENQYAKSHIHVLNVTGKLYPGYCFYMLLNRRLNDSLLHTVSSGFSNGPRQLQIKESFATGARWGWRVPLLPKPAQHGQEDGQLQRKEGVLHACFSGLGGGGLAEVACESRAGPTLGSVGPGPQTPSDPTPL